MEWFLDFLNAYIVPFVIDLALAAIIILVGFALVKVLVKAMQKAKFYEKLDSNARSFLTNVVSVGAKILLVVSAVIVLGVPSAAIITAIGSCGVAIGLALQGGLSNIAGGVVIMICRPFHVGDYIDFGSGEGTVMDIGLYYTKIKTADGLDITVPNASLSNTTVKNYTVDNLRRIDFEFNVVLGTDIDFARKVLLATASVNEKVEKDPAPEVLVANDVQGALGLKLRLYTKADSYWDVYFGTREGVTRAFEKFGISAACPKMNITVTEPAKTEETK